MGNRSDMRIDALQITQHVEMKRTGLDAVGASVTQPLQMLFGRLPLQPADVLFRLDKAPRHGVVARGKHRLRHAQIVDRDREKPREFFVAIAGKGQAPGDLLCKFGQQTLFDDVSDVFEVNGTVGDIGRSMQKTACCQE